MKKKIIIAVMIIILLIGIGGIKFILDTRKYNEYLSKSFTARVKKDYKAALDYVDKASKYKNSDEIYKIKKEIEDDKKLDKEIKDLDKLHKENTEMVKDIKSNKPQLITNSDNLKIWKVYLLAKVNYTFKINVTEGEEDNVIVYLNNDNIINEVGKGNFAGEIEVPQDGWYKLKVETKMGFNWKFE